MPYRKCLVSMTVHFVFSFQPKCRSSLTMCPLQGHDSELTVPAPLRSVLSQYLTRGFLVCLLHANFSVECSQCSIRTRFLFSVLLPEKDLLTNVPRVMPNGCARCPKMQLKTHHPNQHWILPPKPNIPEDMSSGKMDSGHSVLASGGAEGDPVLRGCPSGWKYSCQYFYSQEFLPSQKN